MSFIPALKHDALTPLYDALIRLMLPEIRFKEQLIRSASIAEDHQVLDVGCGTGTLLLLVRKARQEASLVGVDPDERILRRARRKMGGSARLEQASATKLPFASETFDRVLSTLTFHHLTGDEKIAAMREVFRVLKPGGEFHLGDFGQPDSWFMRIASFLTEKIGREHVQENYRGMLPAMLESAGFAMVHETARFGTAFGVLRCLRAVRQPAVFSEAPTLTQDREICSRATAFEIEVSP